MDAGITLNPSVQDISNAVNRTNSENVILLPNSRNLMPIAMQFAESSPKTVMVLSATTIPEGIAAIIAFNTDLDFDSNIADMEEALASIRTGEVKEVVDEANLDGIVLKIGQLIGMVDERLVTIGDRLTDVVVSVLREAKVSEGDLVTFYWGEDVTGDATVEVVKNVGAAFPGVELEAVDGGQSHCQVIISIE